MHISQDIIHMGILKLLWRVCLYICGKEQSNIGNLMFLVKKERAMKNKKTHSAQVFLDSFSGVQLTKKVTSGYIIKITIERVCLVQAMYSFRYQKMVLIYWYEPFPFPLGWIPNYWGKLKMGTPKGHCKKKLYWKQK